MKKILLVCAVLFMCLFPNMVEARSQLDTALDNLYENIEIHTQNNEKRADILENMLDKLDDMYDNTSRSDVRSVISQMRTKIRKQIRKYRNRSNGNYDASDIVDRLLGDYSYGYDDSSDSSDDYDVEGESYSKNYSDVEVGDTVKVGELSISNGSRYDTVDIRVKVDFNNANTNMFSRLYFKSRSGHVYSSSRYEDSGDYRYYNFENLKVGTRYNMYALVGGMDKNTSKIEINLYRVNGGDISSRKIGKVQIKKKKERVNDDDNYYDEDSYYEGDYIEVRSDYYTTLMYNKAEKNDVIELGKFETRGGRVGTKTDLELRFGTEASSFRLRNVYIEANGQKIFANGGRGTVYPNRDVVFKNVLSDSFYTVYGQIEYIRKEDLRIITRFESMQYGELVGANIFGIAQLKGHIPTTNTNTNTNTNNNNTNTGNTGGNNHTPTTTVKKDIYFSLPSGATVVNMENANLGNSRQVASFRLSGKNNSTDIYIRFGYENNNNKRITAQSISLLDNNNVRYTGVRVSSGNNGDLYRFSRLKSQRTYRLYSSFDRKRTGNDTVFVRLDSASNVKNINSFTGKLIGKILLRDNYNNSGNTDSNPDYDGWYY